MLGNAMSVNVLERILVRALMASGIEWDWAPQRWESLSAARETMREFHLPLMGRSAAARGYALDQAAASTPGGRGYALDQAAARAPRGQGHALDLEASMQGGRGAVRTSLTKGSGG